jgi:hypothetical protein
MLQLLGGVYTSGLLLRGLIPGTDLIFFVGPLSSLAPVSHRLISPGILHVSSIGLVRSSIANGCAMVVYKRTEAALNAMRDTNAPAAPKAL